MSEQAPKPCHRCNTNEELLEWRGGGVSCANKDCYVDAPSIEVWNRRPIEGKLWATLKKKEVTIVKLIGWKNERDDLIDTLQEKLDKAAERMKHAGLLLERDSSNIWPAVGVLIEAITELEAINERTS